ncbi:hypothetical protein RB595_008537 [Gaeumannomyces hyphopodioides]
MTPFLLSWALLARISAAAFPVWPQGNQQYLDSRPLETGHPDPNVIDSWAPITTAPPAAGPRGLLSESRLGDSTGTSSWLNSKTCGWFTGHPSLPFTCDDGWTCSTDTNHVVGCTTTNYFPSFAICYDYEAQRSGRCSSLGALTGCCSFSDYPACGTFLWVESTPRSMLRCMRSTSIISINDRPQFVVDADVTATASPSSPQTTTSDIVPLSTIPNSSGNSGDGGGIHLGALVGAIGGVIAMIFILLLALFCYYRKRGPSDCRQVDDGRRPHISAPIPMMDLPAAALARQTPFPPRDPTTGEPLRGGPDPYDWTRSRTRSPSLDGVPCGIPERSSSRPHWQTAGAAVDRKA